MRISVVPLTLTAAAAVALASCASTPSRAITDPSNTITPCSSAPHCVSSKNAVDSARHVDAFKFDGSTEQAHAALLQALHSHEDARIESDVMPVVRSTFRTTVGFVDDVTPNHAVISKRTRLPFATNSATSALLIASASGVLPAVYPSHRSRPLDLHS